MHPIQKQRRRTFWKLLALFLLVFASARSTSVIFVGYQPRFLLLDLPLIALQVLGARVIAYR